MLVIIYAAGKFDGVEPDQTTPLDLTSPIMQEIADLEVERGLSPPLPVNPEPEVIVLDDDDDDEKRNECSSDGQASRSKAVKVPEKRSTGIYCLTSVSLCREVSSSMS